MSTASISRTARPPRCILHVDMDAFYASVEQLDHPHLRGKPVIVGGLGGRGVVAAASYEVRPFGVRSAMPMREALRRCPHALCVAPRFERYKAVSATIFALFREFTPLVQGLSLDEAYLDVTASLTAFGPAEDIAAAIKRQIRERTGLTASVGVGPNKLVAKIASDLRKPDALVVVPASEVRDFLDPLPASRLPGVGGKTAASLARHGIHTVRDLRLAPDAILRPVFGRYAAHMKARAAGMDERPVLPDWDEKQISAEETFDTDIADPARLRAALARLADRMAGRLRAKGWLAERVMVKIRRGDFRTYTRQCVVRPATQETQPLARAAIRLLDEWLDAQAGAGVRLLGVGAGDLTKAPQLDLFGVPESARNRKLDAAIDGIRARFGAHAVARGTMPPRRA